jgi:hypothetical protein
LDVDLGLDGRSSAKAAHAASFSSCRREHCLVGVSGNSQYNDATSAHKTLTAATTSVWLAMVRLEFCHQFNRFCLPSEVFSYFAGLGNCVDLFLVIFLGYF